MSSLFSRLSADDEIKGRNYSTGPSLDLGNLTVSMSERQLREVVECGIDLLADLNIGRQAGCEGSDMPNDRRVA